MAKIRLCVDHPLGSGQEFALSEAQAHYLFSVMRETVGAQLLVFNGRDGEWLAEVKSLARRGGVLGCLAQSRPQLPAPDLWLLFAPVKKARTDMIVEKAVELGASRIMPVGTDFTNSDRMRQDKAEAHVREAAEQCGAMHLPGVAVLAPLKKVIAGWDPARKILWADESAARCPQHFANPIATAKAGPWAVLVGPEGGFSDSERETLRALPYVVPVALGPRILRAETAAIALLTLWQAHLGDWQS
ncbi:MAG: 16S rRNA (uracil(1498)-N(3))-methyltransferase [Albidovulum sp.]